MAAILTRHVFYPSSKEVQDLRPAAWTDTGKLPRYQRMTRKTKPRRPVPYGEPHHWAYLADWRDVSGLTQENVAGTFSVSGVTVHRWETGKAPVSNANMAKLAELYGATDVGMLSLPPPRRDDVAAIREAWTIVATLPPEQRADWLAHGRVLRAAAEAKAKLTQDEK
jgi:transcriptional regulator with XRE-family HTH domain